MKGGLDPERRLLMPGEAAELLHVGVKTLTRWEQAGKLHAIRTLGGHRRYREAEVLAIADSWKHGEDVRAEGPDRKR